MKPVSKKGEFQASHLNQWEFGTSMVTRTQRSQKNPPGILRLTGVDRFDGSKNHWDAFFHCSQEWAIGNSRTLCSHEVFRHWQGDFVYKRTRCGRFVLCVINKHRYPWSNLYSQDAELIIVLPVSDSMLLFCYNQGAGILNQGQTHGRLTQRTLLLRGSSSPL